MGVADPHCHTTASDGMVTPAQLVAGALAAGLDLIAVTDHDTMASTSEAVARGEEAGLAVVRGQEVTTRWPAQTHVVGWFLERPVRMGMSLLDTVDAIHDQGGLAMIPHPFMPTYFASCQPGALARLIGVETAAHGTPDRRAEPRRVDAIELLFTAPTTAARRRQLDHFFARHADRLGAAVGGSDSHFGRHDLGRVLTRFEGTSAADFRRAVETRKTVPTLGRRSPIPAALLARQQVRSLVELPLRRLFGQLE